jgi:hypothetical protein
MFLATIITTLTLLIGPPASKSPLPAQDSPQSQSSSQTSDSPNAAASQPPPASKTCPASSESGSTKPADCPPTSSAKKKKHRPPSNTRSTTVVRNGGTSDPIVAIVPTQSDQEASQQLNNTNQLLASADLNLKQLAGRRLSADQEDTVKQIKVYMQQARTATKNGEAQRAYNLANKANMLSADLVGPHP